MKADLLERVTRHGQQLIKLFGLPDDTDPVKLCKQLRKLEAKAAAIGLRLCNGPEYPNEDDADKACEAILKQVRKLFGWEYQPRLGPKCSCKAGIERDNCGTCEGTGYMIDFRRIRNRPRVPIFVNRDPRGYALKIDDEWMRAQKDCPLTYTDWGGYGIIAPDLREGS